MRSPSTTRTSHWAAGAVAVVLAVAVAQFVAGGLVVLLSAAIVASIVVMTRFEFENLVVAFVWSLSLVHLVKRLLFLAGPQPRLAYYSILFIPNALLIVALIRRPRRGRRLLNQAPGLLLVGFGLLAVAATLLLSPGVPIFVRIAALNERIFPMAAFVVGLGLTLGSQGFVRLTRAIVLSALVSVPYALIQLATGPGPMERAWALQTANYSIQAQKIVDYIKNAPGSDWRPFSYHADPLTWGLFLVIALGVAFANKSAPSDVKVRLPAVTTLALTVGLLASFSRTPWLGLMGMLIGFYILRWRRARRPVLLLGLLLASFALAINVGSFLYEKVFPKLGTQHGGAAEARYLNFGTVQARLDSWSALPKELSAHPVLGAGYGQLALATQQFGKVVTGDPGKHNLLVETAVATGGVGLLFLLAFFAAVFHAGLRAPPRVAVSARWIVALVFGLFLTGYGNVGVFLDANLFLLCGVLAASQVDGIVSFGSMRRSATSTPGPYEGVVVTDEQS